MEHNLMAPFAPKGETAQWRIVYRAFQNAEVGDTLTYAQLAELLDMDPKHERHRVQAAARRAIRQFLTVDNRAVEVIPDKGYRLVPAERQIPLAGAQVERAVRHMGRGEELTVHVRLDELSDESRAIVQAMALGFSQVAEYARQMTKRMDGYEGRLADVEAELARRRDTSGG